LISILSDLGCKCSNTHIVHSTGTLSKHLQGGRITVKLHTKGRFGDNVIVIKIMHNRGFGYRHRLEHNLLRTARDEEDSHHGDCLGIE